MNAALVRKGDFFQKHEKILWTFFTLLPSFCFDFLMNFFNYNLDLD